MAMTMVFYVMVKFEILKSGIQRLNFAKQSKFPNQKLRTDLPFQCFVLCIF